MGYVCATVYPSIKLKHQAQRAPAVSAHSLLPIWTSREQHRANANSSSSPVNMELAPTRSLGKPWHQKRLFSLITKIDAKTYEVIHDAPHMVGDLPLLAIGIVREDFVYRYLGRHEELRLGIGVSGSFSQAEILGSTKANAYLALITGWSRARSIQTRIIIQER